MSEQGHISPPLPPRTITHQDIYLLYVRFRLATATATAPAIEVQHTFRWHGESFRLCARRRCRGKDAEHDAAVASREAAQAREPSIMNEEAEKLEERRASGLPDNQVQQAEDQLALTRSALRTSRQWLRPVQKSVQRDP